MESRAYKVWSVHSTEGPTRLSVSTPLVANAEEQRADFGFCAGWEITAGRRCCQRLWVGKKTVPYVAAGSDHLQGRHVYSAGSERALDALCTEYTCRGPGSRDISRNPLVYQGRFLWPARRQCGHEVHTKRRRRRIRTISEDTERTMSCCIECSSRPTFRYSNTARDSCSVFVRFDNYDTTLSSRSVAQLAP